MVSLFHFRRSDGHRCLPHLTILETNESYFDCLAALSARAMCERASMAMRKVSCGVIAGGSVTRTTLVTTFGLGSAGGLALGGSGSVSASSPGSGAVGGGGKGTTVIFGLFFEPGGLPRPLLAGSAGGGGAGGSAGVGSGGSSGGASATGSAVGSGSIYRPQYFIVR